MANLRALVKDNMWGVIPYLPESPLERGEHPRFIFTSVERDSIVSSLGTGGGLNSQTQTWLTWLNSEMTSKTAAQMFAAKDTLRPWYVMNVALAYLMSGGSTWNGTSAVAQTAIPGLNFGSYTSDDYLNRVKALLVLFLGTANTIGAESGQAFILGYDWCFAGLSTTERQNVANWFAGRTPGATSNRGDAGDVQERMMLVSSALAIKNDGYQSAWSTLYNRFDDWVRGSDGVTSGNSGGVTTGGGYVQGLLYGISYTQAPVLMMEEYARTALGLDAGTHYNTEAYAFKYLPRYYFRILTGDAYPRSTITSARAVPRTNGYQYTFYNGELEHWAPPGGGNGTGTEDAVSPMLWAASTFIAADPNVAKLAKWYIVNRCGYPALTASDLQYGSALWYLLFGRRVADVETVSSPADCGESLSQSSPEGRYIFRTNLSAASIDHPTIMILAQRWAAGGYGFRHCGEIHIYRKGPQMVRRGIAQGHDNIGSWQGSILTFPKLNATRTELTGTSSGTVLSNHDALGAERLTTSAEGTPVSTFYAVGGANDCQLTAPREYLNNGNPDVDYVGMDLRGQYSSYTSRLTSYWRHVVYFRPANPTTDPVTLVVFDYPVVISPYNFGDSTGTYGKSLCWTLAGEPNFVNGNTNIGPDRGPTGTHGKLYSDDCTVISAVNTANSANGKTYLSFLLPNANYRVIKVGGPSSEGLNFRYNTESGKTADLWSHELETVFGYMSGTNYGVSDPAAYREYAGQWFVEIQDRSADTNTPFMTVVECGDSGLTKAATSLLTSTSCYATLVGSKIAVFGTHPTTYVSSLDFTIPTAGTYKVLISCLTPNTAFSVTGGSVSGSTTSSSAGTLYLTITTSSSNVVISVS